MVVIHPRADGGVEGLTGIFAPRVSTGCRVVARVCYLGKSSVLCMQRTDLPTPLRAA